MKKYKLIIITLFTLIIISACSSGGGIKEVDIEKANELFDGESGYLLVYLDDDNKYLDELEKISKDKGKQVLLYDPYKKDGKTENNKPEYPEEDVEGNMLYLIKEGKIKGEVDVNVYQGTELENEVEFLFKD